MNESEIQRSSADRVIWGAEVTMQKVSSQKSACDPCLVIFALMSVCGLCSAILPARYAYGHDAATATSAAGHGWEI